MAPKKALPPAPSTPEEEEETSEEESEEGEEGEEFEEDSEVEEKEESKEKTTQIQPTPPPPAPQSEEEEEESGSEEEGEGEEDEESDFPPSPNASDFTVKLITPTKRASTDAKPTPKRALDSPKDDGKDLRDRKKAKINERQDKKEKGSAVSASGGTGRLWSEDDEIAVLEGMIDYQNRRGADPSTDMAAFYEFVKGKLLADMSKTQLYEKVRRLKKKFSANVEKAESGEDPVFSKPHESRAFDLSKRIWSSGAQSNGGGVDNVNAKGYAGKARKGGKIGSISGIVKEGGRKSMAGIVKEGEKDDSVMDDMRGDGNFQSRYPHLSQSFNLDGSRFFPNGALSCLKENLSLIDNEKARELDEKWKNLREQEVEFFLKRMTLMAEQTKLVLNAGKKR